MWLPDSVPDNRGVLDDVTLPSLETSALFVQRHSLTVLAAFNATFCRAKVQCTAAFTKEKWVCKQEVTPERAGSIVDHDQ